MVVQDVEFNFRHPVEVRFRDIDMGGHAHHGQALIYMEEARAAYWRTVVGRPGLDDIDYVLAEVTVRYHQRVLWPDTLDVGVRVTRMGRKHFEMTYEVRSPERGRLVTGHTTQVMYDYDAGKSKRISAETRARIGSFDGPF
jgi:acyl-CoA thioester hydrolase